MRGRLVIVATAFIALAPACSSSDGGGTPATGVTSEGVTAEGVGPEGFECVRSEPVDKTDLSRALHRDCCCDARPRHLEGQPENIAVVDCSRATRECVNAVLDTNGFRQPPWSASIKAEPCTILAVSYDPCGGVCKPAPQDSTADGGGDPDERDCHAW